MVKRLFWSMNWVVAGWICGLILPGFAMDDAFFIEQVQPILQTKCISCHGPAQQMGNLRLDKPSFAIKGGFNGPAVSEREPENSLLIRKVLGAAEGERMPMGMDPLNEEEISVLKRWVSSGFNWPTDEGQEDEPISNHWAFLPRAEVQPPKVSHTEWALNPIDQFVLHPLEEKGFLPSLPASRETLIRRLYLDIIGLLPTPEEVESFVDDDSPNAYEEVVDRLLASPHYGERWGRHWLDLARYADSDGYEKDSPRPYAWRYRDWVIEALNRDLPFDQFTIQQLAGDLLPNASLDQKRATGFHRNTLTNREGGVDFEEFRVKSVKDRTNTTGQVWLGLTIACAECHNHKYDPISQEEYYGLFAFFNTAEEDDLSAPFENELRSYQENKIKFDSVHHRLVEALDTYRGEQFPDRFNQWLNNVTLPPERWELLQPLTMSSAVEGVTFALLDDRSILVGGKRPNDDTYTVEFSTHLKGITAFQLETLPHDGFRKKGSGRSNDGDFVITEVKLLVDDKPVPLQNASADLEAKGWSAGLVLDGSAATGWSVEQQANRPHRLVVQTGEPLGRGESTILKLVIEQAHGAIHTLGRFRIFATTHDQPVEARDMPVSVVRALRKSSHERTPDERSMLIDFYKERDSIYREIEQTIDKHRETEPRYPNTFIQAFKANPRDTYLMERGDFLRPGKRVEPHVPSILSAIRPRSNTPDRLDLARWLVDPQHPLTARVAVNRIWQSLFDVGLVETSEDFGTRGEKPSHPELLDWLANEFIRLGWSQKQLIKRIVLSNTYRQSSAMRNELFDIDPKNKLLYRQNRFRLQAEILRDISLQASGLLNRAIGGSSIRPPLPEDIADLGYAYSVRWEPSQGAEQYRRGLYIFFQRTVPFPMLMTFDCPDSNVSISRRTRSNTPLQALTLLNDPVFFECAQQLAGRILTEGPSSTQERIVFAFQLCLSRNPTEPELNRLRRLFNELYQLHLKHSTQSHVIAIRQSDADASAIEKDTWTAFGRTLMNLEEFMTRE